MRCLPWKPDSAEKNQENGIVTLLDKIDPLWRSSPAGRIMPVDDHVRLRVVLVDTILGPVTAIMSVAQSVEIATEYRIGTGLSFTVANTGSALPYYACVYRRDRQRPSIPAYIVVPMTPSNLSPSVLHAGLRAVMHRYRDSRDCEHWPEGPCDLRAEALVSRVLIRTFRRMVHLGVIHGCITTLEAFVFLKIKFDATRGAMFDFDLTEARDVTNAPPFDTLCCSAVGQVLGFTMVALDWTSRNGPLDYDDRQDALRSINDWEDRLAAVYAL